MPEAVVCIDGLTEGIWVYSLLFFTFVLSFFPCILNSTLRIMQLDRFHLLTHHIFYIQPPGDKPPSKHSAKRTTSHATRDSGVKSYTESTRCKLTL